MTSNDAIQEFLNCSTFAVVGASNNRAKYGNKVLRCYLQNDLPAIPIHPSESIIEGQTAYSKLSDMPTKPDAVSIITPPSVTESVMDEIIELGIQHVWMQPGAESDDAIRKGESAGINVIANGPCLLVALGYRE